MMDRFFFYFFCVVSFPILESILSSSIAVADNTTSFTGYYEGTKLGVPFVLELTQSNERVVGSLKLQSQANATTSISDFLIDCTLTPAGAQGTMMDSLIKKTSSIRLEIIDEQKIYMYETRQTMFQKESKEILWNFTRTDPPKKQTRKTNTSQSTQSNQTSQSNSISSANSSCSEMITNKRIQENLDAIQMSFLKKDLERLNEYVVEVQSNISCLQEVIDSNTVFQMHQLFGMYHWINKAETDAKTSFAAAKAIDSTKSIDTYIYPKGHTIHSLYEQTKLPENQSVKYPEDNQIYYFDGKKTFYRHKDTPTIFQIEQDGKILLSQYILAHEELPISSTSVE